MYCQNAILSLNIMDLNFHSTECRQLCSSSRSSGTTGAFAMLLASCAIVSIFGNDNTHHSAVIMGAMASQITSLTVVYSTVNSGADQRKHQSSALPAFVRGIHRSPVNSPHKGPVARKMFLFDDVIMLRGRSLLMQSFRYSAILTPLPSLNFLRHDLLLWHSF